MPISPIRPYNPYVAPAKKQSSAKAIAKKVAIRLLQLLLVVVLPFGLLVRGSVFFYRYAGFNGWGAVVLGAVVAGFVIFIYIYLLHRYFSWQLSRKRLKFAAVFSVSLVVVYSVYSLWFFSAGNAQTQRVEKEFTQIHPLLRLGLSTIILADAELVVTSAGRSAKDYKRMGLRVNNQSLHYPQVDGYIYAVDLHTRTRFFLRNWLLQGWFELMGFDTLRHVGTADHLHISLPYNGE